MNHAALAKEKAQAHSACACAPIESAVCLPAGRPPAANLSEWCRSAGYCSSPALQGEHCVRCVGIVWSALRGGSPRPKLLGARGAGPRGLPTLRVSRCKLQPPAAFGPGAALLSPGKERRRSNVYKALHISGLCTQHTDPQSSGQRPTRRDRAAQLVLAQVEFLHAWCVKCCASLRPRNHHANRLQLKALGDLVRPIERFPVCCSQYVSERIYINARL